jgi:preprotein translocase subunit SecD
MLLGILGGNLFSPTAWHKDFKVGLGLDLSSGTEVTMTATTPTGGNPSAQELNETISIITSRVNGTGNSGATVQTQGSNIIAVAIPGKTSPEVVKLVSTTALLRFRQVLREASGLTSAATVTPSSTPSASPSAQLIAISQRHRDG